MKTTKTTEKNSSKSLQLTVKLSRYDRQVLRRANDSSCADLDISEVKPFDLDECAEVFYNVIKQYLEDAQAKAEDGEE